MVSSPANLPPALPTRLRESGEDRRARILRELEADAAVVPAGPEKAARANLRGRRRQPDTESRYRAAFARYTSDRTATLQALASEFGTTASYLSQCFKRFRKEAHAPAVKPGGKIL